MRRKLARALPALLAALALLLGGCTALLNDGRTVIEEDTIAVEGGGAVDRAIAAFDAEPPPQERYYYYQVSGADHPVTQNPIYTCLYGTPDNADADTNPNALNGSAGGAGMWRWSWTP